jgi:hypothetical protein
LFFTGLTLNDTEGRYCPGHSRVEDPGLDFLLKLSYILLYKTFLGRIGNGKTFSSNEAHVFVGLYTLNSIMSVSSHVLSVEIISKKGEFTVER